MSIWYCTREDVKSALDIKETARSNAQVDRAIDAASRAVESLTRRRFYPELATRYFDWPNEQYAKSWRLWLDENELVSLQSLVAGGVSVTNVNLEPNWGPPYDRVEVDLSGSGSLSSGDTYQRAIAITGVYGYDNVLESRGVVSTSMSSSTTTLVVSDGSIGVGDLLLIDDERVVVKNKSWVTTSDTLSATLTDSLADDSVAVSDGSTYSINEIILAGSERMLVVDIVANNLIVKRAWDGTTLASHASGSTIYALRSLTVERAVLGTTATGHLSDAVIYRQVFHPSAVSLCIAEALNTLLQEQSGYARTVGSGEAARPASGAGLNALREKTKLSIGRYSRMEAI